LEATTPSTVSAARALAAVKRGLKTGLNDRERTVLLMLDETIITETPPLYYCYGHIGEQVRVPITGNRSKRILHGAINVRSGDTVLLITEEWVNQAHQMFLAMVRSHWRGSCRWFALTGEVGTSCSLRIEPPNIPHRRVASGPRTWESKSACCRARLPS
jgi:hypothetical protein